MRTTNQIRNLETNPNRKFFHWSKMEEFQSNMWLEVPIDTRPQYVVATADLMRSPSDFEIAMLKAVIKWPNSTAAALTTPSLNYQAWVGHAGCAFELGAPEHLTRQGWGTLTQAEQDAANEAATRAINYWRANYAETQTGG